MRAIAADLAMILSVTSHHPCMKNNKQTAHTPKELLGELQGIAGEAQTMLAGSLSEHSVKVFGDLRTRFDAAHERFAEAYA